MSLRKALEERLQVIEAATGTAYKFAAVAALRAALSVHAPDSADAEPDSTVMAIAEALGVDA